MRFMQFRAKDCYSLALSKLEKVSRSARGWLPPVGGKLLNDQSQHAPKYFCCVQTVKVHLFVFFIFFQMQVCFFLKSCLCGCLFVFFFVFFSRLSEIRALTWLSCSACHLPPAGSSASACWTRCCTRWIHTLSSFYLIFQPYLCSQCRMMIKQINSVCWLKVSWTLLWIWMLIWGETN